MCVLAVQAVAGGGAELLPQRGVVGEFEESGGHRGDVAFAYQSSVDAVGDHFWYARMVGGDDGQPGGHGFEDRERLSLGVTVVGHHGVVQQDVSAAGEAKGSVVWLATVQPYPVRDLVPVDIGTYLGGERAVTDHIERQMRVAGGRAPEGVEQEQRSFLWYQPSDRNAPDLVLATGRRPGRWDVDAVSDDVDLAGGKSRIHEK